MKIDTYKIIVLLFALSVGVFAKAQTADEIIAKHIKAHGGEKNWEKLDAIAIHGMFTAFSVEKEFYALKTKEGFYFSDLYLNDDKKVVEGNDGENYWVNDPWFEIPYARKTNRAETNVMIQKADLVTPFYKYKEHGYTVEYLGQKEIEGVDAHVLKLTRANGFEETWYLDASTYLEFKCESMWSDFARALPCETFFEDFREVDGLVLPFYVERMFGQRNRMLTIEKIEINPEYDPAVFEMPFMDQMKELSFMKGNWNVNVEAMNRSGKWQTVYQTTSNITSEASNLIKFALNYESFFNYLLVFNISFTPSSDKYRMTMFNELSPGIELFEGELKNGALTFDNAKYAALYDNGEFMQISIFDISKDEFKMELRTSRDKGINWIPSDRYIFKRK